MLQFCSLIQSIMNETLISFLWCLRVFNCTFLWEQSSLSLDCFETCFVFNNHRSFTLHWLFIHTSSNNNNGDVCCFKLTHSCLLFFNRFIIEINEQRWWQKTFELNSQIRKIKSWRIEKKKKDWNLVIISSL